MTRQPPWIATAQASMVLASLALTAVAAPGGEHSWGATSVQGTVYWDVNGNGRRDDGEAGAAGMRVTALCHTVTTDANGHYQIESDEPFITVALGWPTDTWPTTSWFRRIEGKQETGVDFGVRRERQEFPFVFVHFTDPHGDWQAVRTMLDECRGLPLRPRFFVCTGDMRSGDPTVANVPDLERSFGAIAQALQVFDAPLFLVPGNHDTVGYGGSARQRITQTDVAHPLFGSRCWERFLGPRRWSFACGGIQFIGKEYAEFIDGNWQHAPSRTVQWIKAEMDARPAGTRSLLFAHRPGDGQLVLDFDMTLGLFGDSHTQGRFYPPGSEEPSFDERVLVTGICQSPLGRGATSQRRYNQDGAPTGYRIIVVDKERIDTFYCPLGESRAVLVHSPRRFVAVRAAEEITVRGQVWDPGRKVRRVEVRVGDVAGSAVLVRRLMWVDFKAAISTRSLPDGFHRLTVTAMSPDGRDALSEPYLILTGRAANLPSYGPATLRASVAKLTGPSQVLINGQSVGTIGPEEAGHEVAVGVPAGVLRRLNKVWLEPEKGVAASLRDVRMVQEGNTFVDQHRVFAWGYQPSLTTDKRGTALWFDLAFPGNPVQWSMAKHNDAEGARVREESPADVMILYAAAAVEFQRPPERKR